MESDVVEEGDPSCSHDLEPDRTYDLPDPDMRNPIRVDVCTRCTREVHKATKIGEGPIDTAYYE